ncbi:hypothetical protein YQE_00227, partial [Dendroctonus ponderosae]
MPQNEYMERHASCTVDGLTLKKESDNVKPVSPISELKPFANCAIFNKERRNGKIQMKKIIKAHEEKKAKKVTANVAEGPCPSTCWIVMYNPGPRWAD